MTGAEGDVAAELFAGWAEEGLEHRRVSSANALSWAAIEKCLFTQCSPGCSVEWDGAQRGSGGRETHLEGKITMCPRPVQERPVPKG